MATNIIQPELIPATDKNWKPKEDALVAPTPMSLMQYALEHGQADQLQILQEMYFKDQARKAEMAFNRAMNAAQAEITRISPDAYNQQTKSKWATYAKLDYILRPIYTRHGFALSFDTEPMPPELQITRIKCHVSHIEGHTRTYYQDVPADGKGAKGGDVMTKTHAVGSSDSYGMRYLLKMIFNIAIGEDDNDGNGPVEVRPMKGLDDWVTKIADAHDYQEMRESYDRAFAIAVEEKNQAAKDALIAARDAWRKRRGK